MKAIRAQLIEQLGMECQCRGCPDCMNDGQCGRNYTLEIDHITRIRTSNKAFREWDLRHPNMDNLQLLCYLCHIQKTKTDNAS